MTGIWERCEHCGDQWSWALQPSHGCAAEVAAKHRAAAVFVDRAGLFVGPLPESSSARIRRKIASMPGQTPVADRVGWLKRQIAQVEGFIERDSELLAQTPDDFAVQLSLSSWRSHYDELLGELTAATQPGRVGRKPE